MTKPSIRFTRTTINEMIQKLVKELDLKATDLVVMDQAAAILLMSEEDTRDWFPYQIVFALPREKWRIARTLYNKGVIGNYGARFFDVDEFNRAEESTKFFTGVNLLCQSTARIPVMNDNVKRNYRIENPASILFKIDKGQVATPYNATRDALLSTVQRVCRGKKELDTVDVTYVDGKYYRRDMIRRLLHKRKETLVYCNTLVTDIDYSKLEEESLVAHFGPFEAQKTGLYGYFREGKIVLFGDIHSAKREIENGKLGGRTYIKLVSKIELGLLEPIKDYDDPFKELILR